MEDIYSVLKDLGIEYKEYKHEPFFTCEQADKLYRHLDGGHSKNLFLRNRKGDSHYLVVLESHKRLDLRSFGAQIGETKLGLASPERLMEHLGTTPGSVSPFALINNEDHDVKVYIDNDLLKHDMLHYHPNINTATLGISRDDFVKFLEWTGNEISYVDISA